MRPNRIAQTAAMALTHLKLLPSGVESSVQTPSSDLREKIERVIRLIRPAVQADGGDLELVDITPDGVVEIRLHGACVGCPSSAITLQSGIERNLKAHVSQSLRVKAVD